MQYLNSEDTEELFRNIVETVNVYHGGEASFVFRDGFEMTVMLRDKQVICLVLGRITRSQERREIVYALFTLYSVIHYYPHSKNNKPITAEAPIITNVFSFFQRRSKKQIPAMPRDSMLRFSGITALPSKSARTRMVAAADMISPTEPDRSAVNAFADTKLFDFVNIRCIRVDINMPDIMQPSVATTAPEIPAMRMPTKVGAFTASGPGVICEMVTISVNSCAVSHPALSTTC